MKRILLAIAISLSGCELIDDFGRFHIVDSCAMDGGTADLGDGGCGHD